MFEQLVFLNCKYTKAFTELCAPLNVAILNCRATYLVDFFGLWTKSAPNSFTLPSMTGRSPVLFPLYKCISVTVQLIPLADGRFHPCCPTEIPKKSPFHLDHRLRFVIPEHRFSFLYLRRYFLQLSVRAVRGKNKEPNQRRFQSWSHYTPDTFSFPFCASHFLSNITLNHRRTCGPSWTQKSLCGTYLYLLNILAGLY